MTCNACGRNVPLFDKRTCVECVEAGGPFSYAWKVTPWQREFAWLPILITNGERCGRKAWLRSVDVKRMTVFGRPEISTRLAASADTLPEGQDAQQGLAGTESGAVGSEASETPVTSPVTSPAAGR